MGYKSNTVILNKTGFDLIQNQSRNLFEVNKVYTIKAQGLLGLDVTEDTLIYTRKAIRYTNPNQNANVSKYRHLLDPCWKRITDLKKGDYIGFPILQTSKNIYQINEEEAWLIGRYIADGYINNSRKNKHSKARNQRVVFSIGTHKLDIFLNHLHTYHPCLVDYGTTTRIDICKKRLKELCELCGRAAYEKEIPKVFLDLPVNLLSELLEGYLAGDGCKNKANGENTASTISPKLAVGLQMALHKVKQIPVKIYCQKREGTTRFIKEKEIKQSHDLYYIYWLDRITKQSLGIKLGNYIWQPFKSLEEIDGITETYNYCGGLVNGVFVKQEVKKSWKN